MEHQGAHHGFYLNGREETFDTSPSTGTQDSSLKFLRWKIILGCLLMGSLILKTVLIVITLTGSKCNRSVVPFGLQKNQSIRHKQCIPQNQQEFYVDLHLDQNTAYRELIISPDKKSVVWNPYPQALPNNPHRFDSNPCVLGHEGFTSGLHWWEVEVIAGEAWALGVARESVNRKGSFLSYPECALWAIGSCRTKFFPFNLSCLELLPHQRIQVILDYGRAMVFFLDADSGKLLEVLPGNFSGEKIYPIFCLGLRTRITMLSTWNVLPPVLWIAPLY
ncbi:vespryn-21-like [Sphaerodactylus townsendi]|uniref:vespryn-21-like n=1 Tax=Sphaerodactylus townsendi TaxID=933632 RepID=UPI00202615E9|nr:vespryn-21-like [Sphaerodactylus townsendi]